MTLNQLRRRHPRLIYRNFAVRQEEKNLRVSFNFLLEPDIVFTPKIVIPVMNQESPRRGEEIPAIKNLAFHLGLVEAISYWKSACPPELVIKAGYLSPDQIAWWRNLFIHGLGEFFFRNQIDFTAVDFLTIVCKRKDQILTDSKTQAASGDLILVGGGKDSIVTLESLKNLSGRKAALVLNPWPNALAAVKLAGYSEQIVVERNIDPRLFQLNKQGYLNGHTPFSAYLAFMGIFVAYLHGYKNVISSNELSAGEAGLIYKSVEINHQYSKSFAFEKKFHEYCSKYLFTDQESPGDARRLLNHTAGVNYFSFLRPLYELQIAKIFSSFSGARSFDSPAKGGIAQDDENYDAVFVSCNVGRGKFWCGHCPKCAFSYLSLFPFMSAARLKKIFGGDLFKNPEIQKHILDLVGLGKHKPFDCVGTKDESVLAVGLAIKKIKKQKTKNKKQQEFLMSLEQKLNLDDQQLAKKLEKKIMENWSDQNFLPPAYSTILNRRLLASPGVS